jgi:hypothetical protein
MTIYRRSRIFKSISSENYRRSDGWKMIIYLDDGWGTASHFDMC